MIWFANNSQMKYCSSKNKKRKKENKHKRSQPKSKKRKKNSWYMEIKASTTKTNNTEKNTIPFLSMNDFVLQECQYLIWKKKKTIIRLNFTLEQLYFNIEKVLVFALCTLLIVKWHHFKRNHHVNIYIFLSRRLLLFWAIFVILTCQITTTTKIE